MATNNSRIIVVRAWRNAGRLVIRVLASPGEATPPRQWVFSDTEAACEKVAQIVAELDNSTAPATDQ
jgi:hypothetical protein